MYGNPTLTKGLTYAGALPFWALALSHVTGYQPAVAAAAFLAYGTGIACFMAGTLWSQAQIRRQDPGFMLIVSNVAALASIGALLAFPAVPTAALGLQVLVFLALLAADLDFKRRGDQPGWYFALRRNVTLLVVAAHALVMILT